MKLDPVLIRVAYLTLESHQYAGTGTWAETVAEVIEWETREGFTTEYLQDQRGDGTPLADGTYYMEHDKELAEQVRKALYTLANMTEDEAAEMAFNLTEVGMS
jgi:hypothetical protein